VTSAQHGTVTIVGAGIAGAACAVALRAGGVPVRVLERGRAPGGRMAAPSLRGRRVDIGAGYFTVRDEGFRAVVDAWSAAGLARPWTDTFAIVAPGKAVSTTTGPMRWATPDGLRSLVRALLVDVEVVTGSVVESLPDGDVVLAMPDPQAARLVPVADAVDYEPVIAVVCEFAGRGWPFADAAFVHDHPDLSFIADDGSRRGDQAPVLVAHSSAGRAALHLDDPDSAVGPIVAALWELLDLPEPVWTHSHRWTLAKPAGQHGASFGWTELPDGRRVGLAGDQWCPHGSPRVESAWRSGTDLAAAIIARR
jgi:renalase